MAADPHVSFYFTASEEPARDIYREALGVAVDPPVGGAALRFDAHGVGLHVAVAAAAPAGSGIPASAESWFDAPTTSMRVWDRIFFRTSAGPNFIKAGAIDAGSPAVRLIGLPKADAMVNGTWTREGVLESLGLDPARRTVLYAPTWSPASSLNAIGEALVTRLLATEINLIVKLHDRSRDIRAMYSGGEDWVGRLEPLVRRRRGVIAPGHDISPYLVASDLMITDHSSAGFEVLLRDRPIVRSHRPDLIRNANIHPDYVDLLASVSESR